MLLVLMGCSTSEEPTPTEITSCPTLTEVATNAIAASITGEMTSTQEATATTEAIANDEPISRFW